MMCSPSSRQRKSKNNSMYYKRHPVIVVQDAFVYLYNKKFKSKRSAWLSSPVQESTIIRVHRIIYSVLPAPEGIKALEAMLDLEND